MTTLSAFDGFIVVIYLILVLSVAFYYSKGKDQTLVDYILSGRNLGWFAIGISIFATNISSEHFIGLAGAGAVRGLAVGQFELMAIFTLIILGWFISPIYLKSGVLTVPEILEKRYNRKLRKLFAALTISIYIITKVSVSLFAGGLLFYKIFGLNIYTSAIIIILVTGIYTVIGGANAVIKTNIIQGILLIFAALILTMIGLNKVGGFSGLQQSLPADYFQMFKNANDPDFPWPGILFGAPIIAFWYWCTDQYFVQKILSAKSENDARRGSLLASILKILPIFILVIPGLIAAVLYPELKGDNAYPLLIAGDLLPSGIKGFVIAGILAAIMSSLSSVFNSAAAIFTNDFYKPKHPEANERTYVLVARLATMAMVVLAIICVPLIKIAGSNIYIYLQSAQGFISPPITVVFIFGIFFKWVNSKGAYWALIVGETIGIFRYIVELLIKNGNVQNEYLLYFGNINFLYFSIYLFIFSSVLITTVSLLTRSEENSFYKMTRETLAEVKENIINASPVLGNKTNLFMSAFIVLVIIGLWSIWN